MKFLKTQKKSKSFEISLIKSIGDAVRHLSKNAKFVYCTRMLKNRTYYTNNSIGINFLKYFIIGYKSIGYKNYDRNNNH